MAGTRCEGGENLRGPFLQGLWGGHDAFDKASDEVMAMGKIGVAAIDTARRGEAKGASIGIGIAIGIGIESGYSSLSF